MDQNIKDFGVMIKKMDMEYGKVVTEILTKVSLTVDTDKDQEFIYGKMDENMKEIEWRIENTEKECILE